jgi:hypothetical protein
VEEIIRKLRVRTYNVQLETCRLECESLAQRIEEQDLSDDQRAQIAHRRDKVITTTHAYQFLLELMGRDEK